MTRVRAGDLLITNQEELKSVRLAMNRVFMRSWVHREKQRGRRAWHQIGGERPPAKPMPPSRLALVEKHAFYYYAAMGP